MRRAASPARAERRPLTEARRARRGHRFSSSPSIRRGLTAIGPEATRCRYTGLQCARCQGQAFPPRLRHGSGDAAVAWLDDDRALPRRSWRPRERAIPGGRRTRSPPRRLKGAGYRTAAFVSAFVLSKRFGLGRGFDLYRRSAACGAVRARLERDDRPCARPTCLRQSGQPLLCGCITSTSRALRAARAIRAAGTRVSPIWVKSPPWTNSSAAWYRRSNSMPQVPAAIIVAADHGEATRRSRRAAAWHAALSVDDAGAARDRRSGGGPRRRAIRRSAPAASYNTLLDLAGVASTDSLQSGRTKRSSLARR